MAIALRQSLLALALFLNAQVAFAASLAEKISPTVVAEARQAEYVDVLIVPKSSVTLDAKRLPAARVARLQAVADTLRTAAGASQRGIVADLAARGIEHRAYWVVNVIHARVPTAAVAALAARGDVARIVANPRIRMRLPASTPGEARIAKAVQANLTAVNADAVWAQGYRGQGIVVAGEDTGYQWDHPALRAKYRGWNGSANHSYNWHDAIHAPLRAGENPCGYSSDVPCDDNGHGTHTMGTMVGDDGGLYQIGMAPDARWIGCHNMDRGVGTPATYLECLEWFLAPTDVNDANPDSSKAPHVINNSWACPPIEGCDQVNIALMQQAVENLRAAGILFVASAGNSGTFGCGTVSDPPGTLAATFTVGATLNNGVIANFSSRGPVTSDSSNRLKPDIAAPGVQITSSVSGGGYANADGTSMASPHVAGAAALLMSARPWLIGNPDAIEQALRAGAVPRTDAQNCGGFSGSVVPNAVYGHGFLDVFAALDVTASILFANGFE